MSKKLEDFNPLTIESGTVSARPVDFSAAATCALPSNTTVGGSSISALGTVTTTSANGLCVGPNGTTTPTLNVVCNVSSETTGLNIVGAANGAGLALATTSGQANEALTVDAKGTGTVGINTVGTSSGTVTIGNSTAKSGLTVNGQINSTKANNCSTATALGASGTVSLDPTLSNVFTCTPTSSITLNAASAPAGSVVTVIITSNGSAYAVTPTTNFKSTGAVTTAASAGKILCIQFVGDGTNLNEVSRTTGTGM